MSLFRIVYVSDAVGAASDKLMPLIDIIGVSDRNNRRDHLTGVLVRHDGRFLQAIEGARVDLDRSMARIGGDHRHRDLRILSDRSVAARLFPNWAMARLDSTPDVAGFLASGLAQAEAGQRAERLLVEASRLIAVAP